MLEQPRWISRRKTKLTFLFFHYRHTRLVVILSQSLHLRRGENCREKTKRKTAKKTLYIVSGETSFFSCKHWHDWLSQAMSNGNPFAVQCGICSRWGKAGFFGALQAHFDWTNQSSWSNSRFGSRNASVGAQPQSRIKRLLNSRSFLGFSCSSMGGSRERGGEGGLIWVLIGWLAPKKCTWCRARQRNVVKCVPHVFLHLDNFLSFNQ